jgi:hypothetical protein
MHVSLEPNLDRLRAFLNYDPLTGVFTRRVAADQGGRIPAGTIAGSPNGNGYLYIRVDGMNLPAARIAWFFIHGVWPDCIVDHENTIKTDNRIDNLRLASDAQSNRNRKVHGRNLCGLKGVSKRGKYWRARITVDRETISLGGFGSKEEAYEAYLAKSKELHGEFAHA